MAFETTDRILIISNVWAQCVEHEDTSLCKKTGINTRFVGSRSCITA